MPQLRSPHAGTKKKRKQNKAETCIPQLKILHATRKILRAATKTCTA